MDQGQMRSTAAGRRGHFSPWAAQGGANDFSRTVEELRRYIPLWRQSKVDSILKDVQELSYPEKCLLYLQLPFLRLPGEESVLRPPFSRPHPHVPRPPLSWPQSHPRVPRPCYFSPIRFPLLTSPYAVSPFPSQSPRFTSPVPVSRDLRPHRHVPMGGGGPVERRTPGIREMTRAWILGHLEEHRDGYVPKEDVYSAYKRYCASGNSFRPMVKKDFVDCVHRVFPNVTETRKRLIGGRHRYCYIGVRWRTVDSPPPWRSPPPRPSPGPTGMAMQSQWVEQAPRPDVMEATRAVICDWAQLILVQRFSSLVELARFLVRHNHVTCRHAHAQCLMATERSGARVSGGPRAIPPSGTRWPVAVPAGWAGSARPGAVPPPPVVSPPLVVSPQAPGWSPPPVLGTAGRAPQGQQRRWDLRSVTARPGPPVGTRGDTRGRRQGRGQTNKKQ